MTVHPIEFLSHAQFVHPEERFVPINAVAGTREFPRGLYGSKASRFMLMMARRGNLRRFAKIHAEFGNPFDHDAWADEIVNISAWIEPGWWFSDEWDHPKRWAELTPEAILLYGTGRPYARRAEVPRALWESVERRIKAVRVVGYAHRSGAAIGRRIGLTDDFREDHKLWQIGTAMGRSEASKEKRRAANAAARKAAGATPRGESISALARELDMAPNSLRTKLRRMPEAERQAFLAKHGFENAMSRFRGHDEEREGNASGPEKGTDLSAGAVKPRRGRPQARPPAQKPATKAVGRALAPEWPVALRAIEDITATLLSAVMLPSASPPQPRKAA